MLRGSINEKFLDWLPTFLKNSIENNQNSLRTNLKKVHKEAGVKEWRKDNQDVSYSRSRKSIYCK